jgi:hypothetical protein
MTNDNGFSKKFLMLFICLALNLPGCSPTNESGTNNILTASSSENEVGTTGAPPPLIVDTSTPLLLDNPNVDEKAFAAAASRAASENTACFVCHANYQSEFLAGRHAQANMSCYNCNGESSAHQNDENNITPPEILYSADKVDPFCRGCHTAHKISPRQIITRWLEKKAEEENPSCKGCHESNDVPPEKVVALWKERGLEKVKPDKIVCTDCHGDHRMRVRTIIWDKKTGKLLSTNKGD